MLTGKATENKRKKLKDPRSPTPAWAREEVKDAERAVATQWYRDKIKEKTERSWVDCAA